LEYLFLLRVSNLIQFVNYNKLDKLR